MNYDNYCDSHEPTDEFSVKLHELINGEVKGKIKETVEELESLKSEYILQSQELSKVRNDLRLASVNHDKELKQAAKVAQREYWFDCAVGDKVFILNKNIKTKKCERCDGKGEVKTIIDYVEVKAECPICGTYSKRQKLYFTEYSIIEGNIERLQIELVKDHKWIHIWIKDREYKYEVGGFYQIFRTKEECQVAYDEAIKKQGANQIGI